MAQDAGTQGIKAEAGPAKKPQGAPKPATNKSLPAKKAQSATPSSAEDPSCECGIDPKVRRQMQMEHLKSRIGKTWRLFMANKEGVVGLIMFLCILFMAILAPLLTKYTVDFTAPRIDTYEADEQNVTLNASYRFTDAPIGMQSQESFTGGQTLRRIMVYTRNGTAFIYPVNISAGSRISLGAPTAHPIPQNVSYLKYVLLSFSEGRFFIVANQTLYITTDSLQVIETYNLSYRPKYFSEVWNAYSLLAASSKSTIFMMADEHNATVYSVIQHKKYYGGASYPVTYATHWRDMNLTIAAAPLLVFQPDDAAYTNGTMAVFPTESGLVAHNLTATKLRRNGLWEYQNIAVGERKWNCSFSYAGRQYHRASGSSVIFPYPAPIELGYGKDRILVATSEKEGYLFSYHRSNGTLMWAQKFFINSAQYRDCTLRDLFPSERAGADAAEILVSAVTPAKKSVVASLNIKDGRVSNNQTQFIALAGVVNNQPHFVMGLKQYIISTDLGNTYILDELLKSNASFSILGDAATPSVFLGNIVELRSITGNYFGVITKTNIMYVEAITGTPRAPLPPGKYPSGNTYILGTDDAGHDLWTWLVYGTRTEIMIGVIAALIVTLLGTLIGLIAGYFGGVVDMIVSGFVDVLLSLPGLVVLLLLVSILGSSILNIIIVIGVLSWPGITRVVRAVVMSLKERAYVDSARVTGASSGRIIFVHILPNVMPYTFFYMAISVGGAIITEAALAFLGLGDPNSITWGMTLQYYRTSGAALSAWWWVFPPGVMITVLSLSFYLIGRGFDEVLNPKLRNR